VARDDGALLREPLGDGSHVTRTLQEEDSDNLEPGPFRERAKKRRVEDIE